MLQHGRPLCLRMQLPSLLLAGDQLVWGSTDSWHCKIVSFLT